MRNGGGRTGKGKGRKVLRRLKGDLELAGVRVKKRTRKKRHFCCTERRLGNVVYEAQKHGETKRVKRALITKPTTARGKRGNLAPCQQEDGGGIKNGRDRKGKGRKSLMGNPPFKERTRLVLAMESRKRKDAAQIVYGMGLRPRRVIGRGKTPNKAGATGE